MTDDLRGLTDAEREAWQQLCVLAGGSFRALDMLPFLKTIRAALSRVPVAGEAVAPKDDRLLPCPYCGSNAKLHFNGEYWATCTRVGVCYGHQDPAARGADGCKLHGFTYAQDAIDLWSRRAAPPSPPVASEQDGDAFEPGWIRQWRGVAQAEHSTTPADDARDAARQSCNVCLDTGVYFMLPAEGGPEVAVKCDCAAAITADQAKGKTT